MSHVFSEKKNSLGFLKAEPETPLPRQAVIGSQRLQFPVPWLTLPAWDPLVRSIFPKASQKIARSEAVNYQDIACKRVRIDPAEAEHILLCWPIFLEVVCMSEAEAP